jgi:single-strand DNA-binding protein
MNKFICIGRITKDIDLTTTNNGTSVAKFSIAVDRRFKNEAGEKITDFFNCVAWRGLGENIAKYCKKGSKVFVAGELQNRSWEAEDGTKRYATDINVNECEFLDTKNDNKEQTNANELQPIDDNDLPF